MDAQLRSRALAHTMANGAAGAAAAALATSGLLHLLQSPMHLDHSWEHAAVLAGVGATDLAWAAAWLRSRSEWLLRAGVFLSVMTVVLYTISRFLPLPFEGMPEEISPVNLGTQLFEVAGLIALVVYSARLQLKARTVATTTVAAFAGAWAFYGAALMAAALTT
jgi:hypothetical protein